MGHMGVLDMYRIWQNFQGGKLSRFFAQPQIFYDE